MELLEEREITTHIPELKISALQNAGTLKAAGTADFISKSIEMEDLLVKIKELI